jgi:hypothetical protein
MQANTSIHLWLDIWARAIAAYTVIYRIRSKLVCLLAQADAPVQASMCAQARRH